MTRNSDGSNDFTVLPSVTGPKPGDFPLGSRASRAAARAVLERRKPVISYDKDCCTFYDSTVHLNGHARPDYSWMERTPYYQRGQEVRDRERGPVIPDYLDPEWPRRTFASIFFEHLIGGFPEPGDILRFADLAAIFSPQKISAEVATIQGAWARRLPDELCPFGYQDGRMLIHQDDGTWKAEFFNHAPTLWHMVENEASGRTIPMGFRGEVVDVLPAIQAVVFIASADGKRRVKPFDLRASATSDKTSKK